MPMRPQYVRCDAAEFTRWVPLNRYSSTFGVGLGVIFADGATLTCEVQHTFDDIYAKRTDFSISRTTTTATATMVNHGLAVGSWVKVTNAGAPLDGEFAVASITDFDHFTYTVANSGATASSGNASIQSARVFAHDALTALSANADGNYEFPPVACRLNCSAYTDGFVELAIISAGQ